MTQIKHWTDHLSELPGFAPRLVNEDSPAVKVEDGKEWWLNAKYYDTEQEHRRIVRQMKMKMLFDAM